MTAPNTASPNATPNTASQLKLDDESLAEFLQRNGTKLLIGVIVVVLVAAAYWLWQSSSRRKEAFASQELMSARASAEAGNLPLAASDLTRLIDRFGGSKAADEGVILLNQIRLVQGQRDVAINALQEFVRGSHDDHIEASAYGLLAGGLEDKGQLREAGEAYKLAAGHAELDFLKAQFLIDAGRAFAAAGDTTAARSAYAEVLDNYGRIDQAAEARVRMAEIGGTVPPMPRDTIQN
jgi:predicted negative regulator of RcsB-dependent stress response